MRVFISYRRDDVDIVSRIREDIARRGHEVFQDTHGIEYGDVFKTTTLSQLDAASVVLFVIGPNWLRQVLDDTKPDWIRLELEHALQRSTRPRIIPVLVREAKLPKEDELPKSMRDLLGYHAIAIPSGPGYEFFIAQLKRAIEGKTNWGLLKKSAAVGGALLALIVAGLVLAKLVSPATNEPSLPPPGAAAGSDAPPQLISNAATGASGAHGGQPSDAGGSEAAGSGSSTEIAAAKAPEPAVPTKALKGQLGQRCSNGKCQHKLQCIEASDTCEALPLEAGKACDAHAQCASTLCSASKCASLPEQGAACASGRCGPGLTCVSASTTCEKLPLLAGQKCDADGQCQTGLCNASHTCAAPPGPGAPCVDGRCSSGMYCTTGDSSGRCYRVGDHCPTGSPGACANGKYKLVGQRLQCEAPKPTTETCAAGDEDCDGQENETNASGCKSFGVDRDGDGFFVDIRCECGPRDDLVPVPPPRKVDPNGCVRATSTWSTERMGSCNGKGATFDWNHNGAEEKRFQQLGSATGSFGQGCKLTPGWDKTVPACGQTGDWLSDCSEVAGNISRQTSKKKQECR